jgi:AcrR family transcriptional regulator
MPKVVPTYKEQAKERIVQVALRVFAEKGYHEATMEDVAHRLGVSEGTIYLYFKSKRELFKAISDLGEHDVAKILSSAMESGDPLKSFFELATEVYEQYEPLSGLFMELLAEASRDASLRKILKDDFNKDRETMMNFLAELRERGRIGAEADMNSASMAILILFYGYAVTRLLGVGKNEAKRACAEAMRVMFERTLTSSQRSTPDRERKNS